MINSISFNTILNANNTNYSITELNDLKTIHKKYPYYQLSAMLLAKAMLKNNDKDYKKHLSHTATIVQNREVLFDFLYSELLAVPKKQIEQKPIAKNNSPVATKPKIAPKIANKKVDKSSLSKIKSTNKITLPKPITDSKGKALKSKKELMQDVNKRLSEINKTKVVLAKTNTEKTGKTDKKATSKPKQSKAEVLTKSISKLNKSDSKKQTAIKVKKASTKKNSTTTSKLKKKIEVDKKIKSSKITKPTKVKTTVKTADAKKKSIKKPKKEAKQINRGTSIDLIERFIRDEPSINRPEDKDYSSELDFAKDSLTDNYDIVSETMAKLYSQQGNKKKAKKIYEKLILIYPEKSTYFANQILKLEK